MGVIYFTQGLPYHYTHWQATSVYVPLDFLGLEPPRCTEFTVFRYSHVTECLVYSRCSISVHFMNTPPLGESGILGQCTLAALIADVMVTMPLGWKTYRGADKPFSLCGFCTGAPPNSSVPPVAISGQSQILAFSPEPQSEA